MKVPPYIYMTITVVIPTKNRAADLVKAIESIINQSRPLDQLVIIDQSSDDISANAIKARMVNLKTELVYIHNNSISGLVVAKAESLRYATSDIICFLEDDIVLETEYIEEIEKGFQNTENMLGCSGVITNVPPKTRSYYYFFDVFHLGIFKDRRHNVYLSRQSQHQELINSKILSGGLSAWRKDVFRYIKFDTENGFHAMEDIEFSFRASLHFGPRFFINTKARLAHYFSPVNREGIYNKNRRKVRERVLFYKKHSNQPWATLSLAWLIIGYLILSTAESVRDMNFTYRVSAEDRIFLNG